MITAAQMAWFAPGCDASGIAPGLSAAAEKYDITPGHRLNHWMGQLHVESGGFKRLVENLNYSAERLNQVWPGRFPTLESAQPYARNPQKLAIKVYGARLGNATPEDAWRFVGRGWVQITGRDNYRHMAELTGYDLLKDPGLAGAPEVASRIAGAFWSTHGLNDLADADDIEGITRKVNGGTTGLVDRRLQYGRAKLAFA